MNYITHVCMHANTTHMLLRLEVLKNKTNKQTKNPKNKAAIINNIKNGPSGYGSSEWVRNPTLDLSDPNNQLQPYYHP